jgi:phytanoyl-CoA hydroxylase
VLATMTGLSPASVRHFQEEGYLVVDDLLDVALDIQPVVDEYTTLVDTLVRRWYTEGKLPSTYPDLSFWKRLLKILESDQAAEIYAYLDISLPQSGITADWPIHTGRAVFDVLRSPRLLDAVESLIGPEIYSNPVQHIRIKMPERLVPQDKRSHPMAATTDWHQDQGVVLPEADESEILTVWLPLTNATIDMGCLALVPRSHRELMAHCPGGANGGGLHIPDQLLRPAETMPVPVKQGGALFMHRRTMHSSLPNTSDDIRWSFDLRYNRVGQPTGRPAFPGFVARSRRDPASELRDPEQWAALWHTARATLADQQEKPTFNRWTHGAPVCA